MGEIKLRALRRMEDEFGERGRWKGEREERRGEGRREETRRDDGWRGDGRADPVD